MCKLNVSGVSCWSQRSVCTNSHMQNSGRPWVISRICFLKKVNSPKLFHPFLVHKQWSWSSFMCWDFDICFRIFCHCLKTLELKGFCENSTAICHSIKNILVMLTKWQPSLSTIGTVLYLAIKVNWPLKRQDYNIGELCINTHGYTSTHTPPHSSDLSDCAVCKCFAINLA